MSISPQALIDSSAKIGKDVTIEAFAVVGADVEIGDQCWIGHHAVVQGKTIIANHNKIYPFAYIGGDPQHKKYAGEKTELKIGENNVIREYTTMHRGTAMGGGITSVGHDNWFMAYSHIAHDCHVGSNVIFANAATLGGHVTIGDYVILGGLSAVHQFTQLGAHAFAGGGSIITRDIPPYLIVAGNQAESYGINKEGLRRRGFSQEVIAALHKAYKILIYSRLPRQQAFAKVAPLAATYPEVKYMVDFIRNQSKRGIIR